MHPRSSNASCSLPLFAILATVVAGCGISQVSHRAGVPSSPRCDRPCLTKIVDNYLASLERHDPSGLHLASQVRFTENGRGLKLGEGLWRTANSIGRYRLYVVDPDSGSAAVQTTLKDAGEVVQLQLRLKVEDKRISEIETLIAREGDTCCWAPAQLDSLSAAYDHSVSNTDRMTRAQLVATADAYFTALHTAGTSDYQRTVVATGMDRYENGKRTTNVEGGNRIIRWDAQSQLDKGMFGRISVVNRRYPVIDVEKGTILGIVVFEYPGLDRPSEIISESFKISAGSIREIRAVMVKQPSTGWAR